MRSLPNKVRRPWFRKLCLFEQLEDRRLLSTGLLGGGLLSRLAQPATALVSPVFTSAAPTLNVVSPTSPASEGDSGLLALLPAPVSLDAGLSVSLPTVGSTSVGLNLSLGDADAPLNLGVSADVQLGSSAAVDGGLGLQTGIDLGLGDPQADGIGLGLDVGVAVGGDDGLSVGLGVEADLGGGSLNLSVGADLGDGGLDISVGTGGGQPGESPGSGSGGGSQSPPPASSPPPAGGAAPGDGGGIGFFPRIDDSMIAALTPFPTTTGQESSLPTSGTAPVLLIDLRTENQSSLEASAVDSPEATEETEAPGPAAMETMAGDMIWGENEGGLEGDVVAAVPQSPAVAEGAAVGEEGLPAAPSPNREAVIEGQPSANGELAAAPPGALDGLNLALRQLLEQLSAKMQQAMTGVGPWHWVMWFLAAGTVAIEVECWRRRARKARKAEAADHLGTWMQEMPHPVGEGGHES